MRNQIQLILHQKLFFLQEKLCFFIHINYEQFAGHRKREQDFRSKNVAMAAKTKFWCEIFDKNFSRL